MVLLGRSRYSSLANKASGLVHKNVLQRTQSSGYPATIPTVDAAYDHLSSPACGTLHSDSQDLGLHLPHSPIATPLIRPWCPPSPETQKSARARRRDAGRPLRPRNPFILWRSHFYQNQDYYAQFVGYGESQQNELSKLAGKLWNSMPEDEKAPFVEMAKIEKKWHVRTYPNYVYRNKRKNNASGKHRSSMSSSSSDGVSSPGVHFQPRFVSDSPESSTPSPVSELTLQAFRSLSLSQPDCVTAEILSESAPISLSAPFEPQTSPELVGASSPQIASTCWDSTFLPLSPAYQMPYLSEAPDAYYYDQSTAYYTHDAVSSNNSAEPAPFFVQEYDEAALTVNQGLEYMSPSLETLDYTPFSYPSEGTVDFAYSATMMEYFNWNGCVEDQAHWA